MISVDDDDPLGSISTLRRPENQPYYYKADYYDNSPNAIRTFIFILNDRKDDSRC